MRLLLRQTSLSCKSHASFDASELPHAVFGDSEVTLDRKQLITKNFNHACIKHRTYFGISGTTTLPYQI